MIEYSVLIIDDDIWIQRILAQTMKSYGFKKVYLANNGFDGVALAVEKQPTIIISDILMPEINGHVVLRLLKTIKATKNIPILMVSALSDAENLGKAVKQGTAGFISKPFTRTTVYEKLVDVYGESKIEKIKKGESIEEMDTYYSDTIMKSTMSKAKTEIEKNVDIEGIESIKKMLFDE